MMGFLRRDLRLFRLYKPTEKRNADGEVYNAYETPPAFMFEGNIQPFGERENAAEYGLDPKYSYIVLTKPCGGFAENDRISHDGRVYVIRLIQRWSAHYRLFVTEVEADGYL